MNDLSSLIFSLLILIFSVVVNEVSHGVAAYSLGDPTAKLQGRLTLNPIPHIDLYGSVLLPFLMLTLGSPIVFGYAKPVPYNPYHLKDLKWSPALVAAAGPGSNIALAVSLGLIYQVINVIVPLPLEVLSLFITAVALNLALAVFNSIPIPPLDGSKVLKPFLPESITNSQIYHSFERTGFILLLVFILFFGQVLTPVIRGLTQFLLA